MIAALFLTLVPRAARACNTLVVWQADLKGDGLSPAVQTAAGGIAVFGFNFHNDVGTPDATVAVDLHDARDVTSIDLRAGDRTKPGPILFTLYTRKQGKLRGGHLSKTITEADLQRQSDPRIQTFADVVNAVTGHTAFITVNTRAHPTGELRGDISMRKVPIYSADDSSAGHDPRLHEQAAAKTKKTAKTN